jgi:hypothetical protein
MTKVGEPEAPEVLRDIARRSRMIALAVCGPDRLRVLAYARELEQRANAIERRDGPANSLGGRR